MKNAMSLYRISNFMNNKFKFFSKVIDAITYLVFNSYIPGSANIGKDSKFAYGGIGVVLHANSVIGEKVIIGQGVTIGRQLDPDGVPEIGNNVYISAGARILGKIKVGDNVIIGANAVVIKDVPSNSIVAGVPAKVIRSIDADIYKLLKNVY